MWVSHSTSPRPGQGGTAVPSAQSQHATLFLPPTVWGKSSYSPLLDFLLCNCKRKQKSRLLVQRGGPGDGQTPGGLPPACPSPPRPMACLPLSGHRPALSKDTPPGAQPPSGLSGPPCSAPPAGAALAGPPPLLMPAVLPRTACHSRGWVPPAVLGRAGRTGQRLGHSLFHFSVLGTVGEGAGFPGRSAALPVCGGGGSRQTGPPSRPPAPSTVPSSARPLAPRDGQCCILSQARRAWKVETSQIKWPNPEPGPNCHPSLNRDTKGKHIFFFWKVLHRFKLEPNPCPVSNQ